MKTVVEWLVEELGFVEYEGLSQPEWIKNLILQAKEMEKQQIIDACEKFGNLNGVDIEDYKQYYSETFKKDKTD